MLLITTFSAFLISVGTTPLIIALAHRHNWYDEQNQRKIHTEDTPRLGGIAIYISFSIPVLLSILFFSHTGVPVPWATRSIIFTFVGLTIIHAMGLYDDFVNLPAIYKFLMQVLAAIAVISGGVYIRSIHFPGLGGIALSPYLGIPLTILWITAITNAVNLIDGADGLAGTITAMAAFFMGLLAISQGNGPGAVLGFALVGAIAGFLVYNLPPARIFMGDSGSLMIGFIVAVLPIYGFDGTTGLFSAIPVLTLLYIPIIDTMLAIVRRLVRGLPIHSADREHIHHRLIDRKVTGLRLLLVYFLAMTIFGSVAMAWYATTPVLASVLTALAWVGTFIAITLLANPA